VNRILNNEQSTLDFGAELAQWLPDKGIVYLHGPLGAGKTTLVRGLLKALGHKGNTKSPTYTLVEPYQVKDRRFYHFDLYRLSDPEELEYMGIRDYVEENSLCLIEWPNKGLDFLPKADMELTLTYEQQHRRIKLEINTPSWQTLAGKVGKH